MLVGAQSPSREPRLNEEARGSRPFDCKAAFRSLDTHGGYPALLPPLGSKPACIEGMKDTAPSADPSAAMRGEAWGSIGQDLDGVGCGGVAKCRNDGNRRVQGGPGGEYGVSHYLNRKQIAQLRIEDRSPIRVNIPP